MNRKTKYWELPHVMDQPFVIAVQDFSKAGSLMVSSSTIAHYLFGLKGDWYHDNDGNLVIINKPIEEHGLGLKKIPSGLFAQEGSEYLSGVLFCNTGTYAKFSRMGQQGKYRNPNLRMLRYGTCHRHDPNATKPSPFLMEVGNPEESLETWREGTVLIRNPNAKHPLPSEWLGAGAEDEYEGGQIITTFAESFLPFWSMTENFDARIPNFIIEQRARKIEKVLLQEFPL